MTNNACNFPNPINLPHGGSGVNSLVAYSPILGGTTTTGNLQSVASVGNAGEALTSNGPTSPATFQPLASGGLTLIQSQTASSSASLTFNTGITASGTYVFTLNGVISSDGGSGVLRIYVSNDGGSLWSTSGYIGAAIYAAYNTPPGWLNSGSAGSFYASSGLDTAVQGTTGVLYLSNINTSSLALLSGQAFSYNSMPFFSLLSGISNIVGVNAFKFGFNSGNISSGTISLYHLTQ
jgi:hypothetical protein